MEKKTADGLQNLPKGQCMGCCRVESVVSIDERGQMVIPKEVRDAANIKAGDKLAVVIMRKGDDVCCISLIKADELSGMVRGLLGPMMQDVLKEEEV